MPSNCGAGEDSWESLELQGDQTSQSKRISTLNIHWKDWCWTSNTLTTWCKELTHWRRPWCWERLKAGGEGDDRGWDGWMASLTQWTWMWANSRSSEGLGSLVCCSPWGRTESDMIKKLNNNKNTRRFLKHVNFSNGKSSYSFLLEFLETSLQYSFKIASSFVCLHFR